MKDYDEIPSPNPVKKVNPFRLKRNERRINEKYLSDFVAQQLDRIFRNQNLPIHYRLVYWILRYIPSRVSEVIGMKIDCLKPYGKDWVIIMPTWKENGGYLEPESRLIGVKHKTDGKFLLDLIRKQIAIANRYQMELDKEERGLLFTVDKYHRKKTTENERDKTAYIKCKSKPYLFKYGTCSL